MHFLDSYLCFDGGAVGNLVFDLMSRGVRFGKQVRVRQRSILGFYKLEKRKPEKKMDNLFQKHTAFISKNHRHTRTMKYNSETLMQYLLIKQTIANMSLIAVPGFWNMWWKSYFWLLGPDLGEVPALDEVSGNVSRCPSMNHRGDVVPGHSGSRVPVDEIWNGGKNRFHFQSATHLFTLFWVKSFHLLLSK